MTSQWITAILLTLFLILVLYIIASCGGGGGGTSQPDCGTGLAPVDLSGVCRRNPPTAGALEAIE